MVLMLFPADRPGAEVYPPPLRRAVHVLWLRERVAERRAHALFHRPLDLAKCQHRVRVHSVHLARTRFVLL